MLKKVLLCMLIFMVVILTGCKKNESNLLDYQDKNFETEVKMKMRNEEYSFLVKKKDNSIWKITIISPEKLNGIIVEKTNDGLFYEVGNIKLPIKSDSHFIAQISELFNLSKDNLVSADAVLLNGTKANTAEFKCDFGNVKLYISSETELPIRMEADIYGEQVVLNFINFSINNISTEDTNI